MRNWDGGKCYLDLDSIAMATGELPADAAGWHRGQRGTAGSVAHCYAGCRGPVGWREAVISLRELGEMLWEVMAG